MKFPLKFCTLLLYTLVATEKANLFANFLSQWFTVSLFVCVCFSYLSTATLLLPLTFSRTARAHTRECKLRLEAVFRVQCPVTMPKLNNGTAFCLASSRCYSAFRYSLSRIIIRYLPFCLCLHCFSYCILFLSTLFVCLSSAKCPLDQSSLLADFHSLVCVCVCFALYEVDGTNEAWLNCRSLADCQLSRYSLTRLFTLWHCNSHLWRGQRFLWCHSILKTEAKCYTASCSLFPFCTDLVACLHPADSGDFHHLSQCQLSPITVPDQWQQ